MQKISFSEKELIQAGEYPKIPGPGTLPKYSFPVTPRENYRAAIRDRMPLWIPSYYDFVNLTPACYPDAIARGSVMGPEGADFADDSRKGGIDSFGIQWDYVPVAGGSMVRPGSPLISDMNQWRSKVKMPDVESWAWAKSSENCADFLKNEDGARVMWIFTGLFERLISFMDFEGAALAIIDEDQLDAINDFFTQCCGVYERIIAHYKKDFGCDVVFFHDDWGSQRSPFFSVNTCMDVIVPHLKRLVDYAHSLGMMFEHHSCGKNELLVPCYLAAGIDIWAPQPQNDHIRILKEVDGKIAIGLWGDEHKHGSEEEKYAAGKAFADNYSASYSKQPVFHCDLFNIEEKFKEALYVESRKLLCR